MHLALLSFKQVILMHQLKITGHEKLCDQEIRLERVKKWSARAMQQKSRAGAFIAQEITRIKMYVSLIWQIRL